MKFQTKIIIITLGILIITLLLNSLLSLASFEKIYVSSLISTYEVSGKYLKRKIEQSLKFGKPLDKFKGMEILINETMKKNRDIAFICIANPKGKIFYHSDSDEKGKKILYPMPKFKNREKQKTNAITNLIKGMYVTFLPLYNRAGKLTGVINLAFSREVIYSKLKSMAGENMKVLWVLMIFTSVGLIFSLAFLVVKPIKSEVLEIAEMLQWPPDPYDLSEDKYKTLPEKEEHETMAINPKYMNLENARTELDRLGYHICGFISDCLKKKELIKKLDREFNIIFEDCQAIDEQNRQLVMIVDRLKFEENHNDSLPIERIAIYNRHFIDKLQIVEYILKFQKQIRRTAL